MLPIFPAFKIKYIFFLIEELGKSTSKEVEKPFFMAELDICSI